MKEKLTMIETFSGIGAQIRGFQNSELFDVEVISTSEIDKEAMLSYAAIHCGLTNELINTYQEYPTKEDMLHELKDKNIGYDFKKNIKYDWDKLARRRGKQIEKYWLALHLTKNLGDISLVNELPYCDILTFSFPCQSISIAGKQEGIIKGKTRSGLVYEIVRLIQIAKKNNNLPKYLMLENVAALVGKKFISDFENLNKFFDEIGYNVYWNLINGKNCGIPQNRIRTFGIYIRKDIDTEKFEFPTSFDNGIRLKDLLEELVDEKYYISEDKVSKLLSTLNDTSFVNKKDTEPIRLGNVYGEQFGTGYAGNVWDKNAMCPTLMTMQGGGRQPHITTGILSQKGEKFDKETDIANTLLARDYKGFGNQGMNGVMNFTETCLRIRKLIPKECWRLMGFRDSDCEAASNIGVADSHLYKEAGNSIITNCVRLLAEHLYKAQYDNTYKCTDENFTRPQVG